MRRLSTVCGGLAVALLFPSTVNVAEASGPAWSISATQNATAYTGSLSGIACVGAASCNAVGSRTDTAGRNAAMAETWNGTGWAVRSTPPAGEWASLSGIACTSATACTAVGSYYSTAASDYVTLAEAWSGSSWAVVPTPHPGQSSSLAAVACTASGACMAVGAYYASVGGPSVPLAESWNGTAWTVQTMANPSAPNSDGVFPFGVACTSATACTAVGNYTDATGNFVTLVEAWNGTSWATQTSPNPSGATYTFLAGVSCLSLTACTAVGGASSGAGTTADLAESWNGTSWAIQATPHPGQSSSLSAVSCTPTSCSAVGSYKPLTASADVPLAEAWNGTAWAAQTVPAPSGGSAVLSGIACTAASACIAVGSYPNNAGSGVTLAERWNGSTWAIQPTPDPIGALDTSLHGVTCTASNACVAIGDYSVSTGNRTLAERWNGSSWTISPTPNPGGAVSTTLSGIACAGPTACAAVGSYAQSGNTKTFVEAWNGTSWSIQPTPNPSGASYSALSGVACTTASACTAVGSYRNSSNVLLPLAEAWNGTSWVIQATPHPGQSGGLSGVACFGTSFCKAVGDYYNTTASAYVTFAESWNGTSWKAEPTPNGGVSSVLSAVSCVSATACTAVGNRYNSTLSATVPLSEAWNGSAWVMQSVPSGGRGGSLSGVACSAGGCSAVGYYYSPGAQSDVTLAEKWNGSSWGIEPTPDPPDASSFLSQVSCTAAAACMAVGTQGPLRASTALTLAERYS